MHNKCTKVTKGVDIRYINAIFSPTQSDNRIIADIAGKRNCYYLYVSRNNNYGCNAGTMFDRRR